MLPSQAANTNIYTWVERGSVKVKNAVPKDKTQVKRAQNWFWVQRANQLGHQLLFAI